MKNLIYVLFLLSLLIIGCGDDGSEGRAFLKFDWNYSVTGYDDSNPSIPNIIWKSQSYATDKGTFYFSYSADNGTETRIWSGEYTITKNPGEKGGFLVDGKDGADKHFELYLGWSGPRITSSKANFSHNTEEDMIIQKLFNNKNPNTTNRRSNEVHVETLLDDNFTIILKFHLID